MTDITLPCGCVVDVDHKTGQQRVVCTGNIPNVVPIVDDVGCSGGRGYIITARPTVTYTISAFHPSAGIAS